MKQLQFIYDDLKDNNEIAIIEGYGNNAKRYTTMLTSKKNIFLHLFIFRID